MGHRRLLRSAAVAGLALLFAWAPTQRVDAATAAATSRAGVIVDQGNGTVRRVGITFSGTISGLQALQLAGFAPVVRSFGGIGGAVCAITVGSQQYGCPADGSCLTCDAPDYWTYSRATKGTNTFTIWPAGAGATQVHDGDVEGWRWSTGASPTYVPLAQFFPPPPTTTTAPPATTTTVRSGSGTTLPSTVHQQGGTQPGLATTTGPGTTASRRPGSRSATSTTALGASSTAGTSAGRETSARDGPRSTAASASGARRLAASPPIVRHAAGNSPVVWIVFALVVAAFGVAIATAHRRRARAAGN